MHVIFALEKNPRLKQARNPAITVTKRMYGYQKEMGQKSLYYWMVITKLVSIYKPGKFLH